MIAPMCVSVRLSVLLADRHRCARCPCAAVLPRCRVSVALLSVCLISLPQWYTSSEHLPPGELLTGPMFSGNLYRYDNAQVGQIIMQTNRIGRARLAANHEPASD